MTVLGKRTLRTFCTTLLFVGLSVAAFAESVRVTVDRAALWVNPTGTGGVVGMVNRGEVLEVDKHEGRWLLVTFPADPRRKGYILENQVEATAGGTTPPAARATERPPAQRPAAAARPRRLRRPAFLYVGVTGQATPLDFTITETSTTLLEAETRTTEYTPSRLPGFEFTFGQDVSRRLIIAVGVVRMAGKGSSAVTAQIPHPILYNHPRELSAETDSTRSETSLNLRLDYLLHRGRTFQLTAGAGPSFFFVHQDLIDRLSYVESYPYDSVTLDEAVTKGRDAKAIGAHAEVDITGRLSRNVAWQATGRYAYASPKFELTDSKAKTKVGGAQVGGGLRFVF